MERRPAEAVGFRGGEPLVDEEADDLGRPAGRRGLEELFAGRVEGLQVLPFPIRRERASSGPGTPLRKDRLRPIRPRLPAPWRPSSRSRSTRSALPRQAASSRAVEPYLSAALTSAPASMRMRAVAASPLSRAQRMSGGPLRNRHRVSRAAPCFTRAAAASVRSLHRRDVERRIASSVGGVGLGALGDEEVDERRVLAVGGVMEERQSLGVAGFDQPGGLLDHGLDGWDVALAQKIEHVLGPERSRTGPAEGRRHGRSLHGSSPFAPGNKGTQLRWTIFGPHTRSLGAMAGRRA